MSAAQKPWQIVGIAWAIMIIAGCANPPPAVPPAPVSEVEHDYIMALSTADAFLSAWRLRDQERGLALIAESVRATVPEDDLRMYVCGVSNPHHQAYEIGEGRRVGADRYQFPVCLYESYSCYQYSDKRRPEMIILYRQSGDTWRVETLPGSWKHTAGTP